MRTGHSNMGIAAAVAAVAAGCVSAPVPPAPTAPWRAPDEARRADAVWPSVRAAQPRFERPVTLAEFADLALQNHPATRRAWSNARAAAQQVRHAEGYFMPAVSATAAMDRRRNTGQPAAVDPNTTKYGPGLAINYLMINFGGGREAAVEQALQTVYAADFSFNRAIQDVLFAVETAYYGLVSAEAGVAAAEAAVNDAKTALETVRERKASGLGTQLDVLQAQAACDRARFDLAAAQGAVLTARGRLAAAAGLPADADFQAAAPAADVPASLAKQEMARLIDEALDRRPDVAALRATLAARRAAVTVEAAALWPSLYFNGSLGLDNYDPAEGSGIKERDWSFAADLSLQWTLFDGFRTPSAEAIAVEQVAAAEADLRGAELAAAAEVWSRYHAYETALRKYEASQSYLSSATASSGLALDAYRAGLRSILDVLAADAQAAQARSQSVASRAEVFTALAGLAHACGAMDKAGAPAPAGVIPASRSKESEP